MTNLKTILNRPYVKIIATIPESRHPPLIYSIAILACSTNGVAPIYVQYLLSPKAVPFFERQGFTMAN
jgi:molybdate transport system substrate-binding protein